MTFNSKKQLVEFLAEDIGKKDITSALLSRKKITAKIISRETAIVAGVNHAKNIFKLKKCNVVILKKDGAKISKNQVIMKITGDAKNILSSERTALNLLARMSGIATMTNKMVKKIPKNTKLYATRKTAPGLRYFDKEAVKIGGGQKHRLQLDEMVMIKDNHIAVEKSLSDLIIRAKKRHAKIEVEVENIPDAILAARLGSSIIMLDNFTPALIKKTIKELKRQNLHKKILLEASGNINSKNIASFGATGVNIISIGCITNAVKGVDLSLEVIEQ